MPTSINDLPDELLLQIGANFTHLDRNYDLACLALVSQKWRNVAQEWLIKVPRFNMMYIDQYLWELAHHEHLQPQIRSLEIWSASKKRVFHDAAGRVIRIYRPAHAPQGWDPLFTTKCDEIIDHFARDKKAKVKWATALREDCMPALFGVLISVLPNLKDLRLGNTWLMDCPIFCCMLAGDPLSFMLPVDLHHQFLQGPFEQMLSRLEILDVSADMSSTFFLSKVTTTVFTFARFTNLKEIVITMKALWWHPSTRRPATDPREIFPATLEVLRISEATRHTPDFVQIVCTAKVGGHFPALRRLEIYFMESLAATRENCSFDPVIDLQLSCKQVEISVHMYFPAHELQTWELGCTPWRLREEIGCLSGSTITAILTGAFEAEYEVDGDAVMQI